MLEAAEERAAEDRFKQERKAEKKRRKHSGQDWDNGPDVLLKGGRTQSMGGLALSGALGSTAGSTVRFGGSEVVK